MKLKGRREIQEHDILVDCHYLHTHITPEEALPLHYHHNMELIFVQSGCGEFQIDLQKYHVQAGDMLIIPRGALHAANTISGCSCQVIQFDLNLLDHNYLDTCQIQFLNPLLKNCVTFTHHVQTNHPGYPSICAAFETVVSLFSSKPYGFELGVRGQFLWFFFQLFHYRLAEVNRMPVTVDTKLLKLKTILDFIHENYHQPLSVAQLAQVIEYSEYHFMRFFKSQTGVTCGEYIQHYRLQQAGELLRTSSLSITDIAFECGFETSAYFSTCFKKKYILTPRAYRQRFQVPLN